MSAYKVADAKREYDKLPYRDLWSEWQVATARGTIDAPFLHRAVQEREDPRQISNWALLRDAFRRVRMQKFLLRGGHWKCIKSKMGCGIETSVRKSDWKMISALIALAALFIIVAGKLAQ